MSDLKATLTEQISDERPIILAGDFNFVEDPARYRSNELNQDRVSATLIQEISAEWDLVDAWRVEIGHTWLRVSNGAVQTSRIDRFYLSSSLIPRVLDIKLLCPLVRISDQLPLMIELAPPIEQAPRRFTLNTKLLSDEEIAQSITEIAEETLVAMQEPEANVMANYLAGKKRLHRLLQTRGRAAAIQRREDEQEARDPG